MLPAQAQTGLRPIFDGRLNLNNSKLTPDEDDLLRNGVVPAAHKYWSEQGSDGDCVSGVEPTPLDVAQGSFTRPGAVQRAILYQYCNAGQNLAIGGIAIVEKGKVVCHIVYGGGWDNAIGALPDIDGDGISEIIIGTGGTLQGNTFGGFSVIQIAGGEVHKFITANSYEDDCGVDRKHGKATAYKCYVKKGKTPAFFREKYVNDDVCSGAGTWKKTSGPVEVPPGKNDNEYTILP